MAERNTILVTGNRLKLGLFGPNCSSGRSYITAPERWVTSWEHNVTLAQMADAVGMECMVPIARWKGYGGSSNPNGTAWECITWACGLLAATKRINVFATVHVPLNHPVVAAKQMATADHIGQGRFGINVVCGWNEDEFAMFGVTKKEHDARYEQGAEWWTIVKQIWDGQGPFDFEGEYYQLHGVEGSPQPYGGRAPLMMNAGASEVGRAWALRRADMHFSSYGESPDRVADSRRLAAEQGRTVQLWSGIGVVCRPTLQEAVDFTEYLIEHVDSGAVGNLAEMHARDAKDQAEVIRQYEHIGQGPVERRVMARGSYCAIGDPDWVAQEIARIHGVGLDGLVLNFVNYLDEFPF